MGKDKSEDTLTTDTIASHAMKPRTQLNLTLVLEIGNPTGEK